jgi:hypothetical protein
MAQLPETDVWLFNYSISNGKYIFGDGNNITNHPGYDNQPSFSENGSYMLWTAQRDSNETDIFRFEVANHVTTRITQTAFSEYSPTYMPGNKYISAVVVEKDSVQRLWKFNKVSGEGKPALPKIFGVGYHTWFDDHTLYIFQVTEPSTLVMIDANSQVNKTIVSNVGRCMQIYHSPKRKLLLYTVPDTSGYYWIQALDGLGNKATDFPAIKGLKDSQDFVVDNIGNILMAQGSKLFIWSIGKSTDWELADDFSTHGLTSITRMAISPDGHHFAFVDNTK